MKEPWWRFTGTVRGGHVRIDERIRLDKTVSQWEGKRVEIALREEPDNRSLDQNAYLHVLAREIAKESGESLDYVKCFGTLMALGFEAGTHKEVILGREITIVRRTSELRKDEASKVIEWMLDKCSFLGVTPPREEQVTEVGG